MSVVPTVVSRVAPSRRIIDRTIYTWAGFAAILIVFAGFARTYFLKGIFGTPGLSSLVHLHGVVMTLWFALFFAQVRLVAIERVAWHRRLGVLGGFLAALVVAVGTLTAIQGAARGASPGPPPLVFLAIPLGDMVVFSTLVSLGLGYRRSPDVHKRLLLLATMGILTAAIARIPIDALARGGLPLFFALTDLCILGCVGYDTLRHRRLHPAFGWGFLFIIATQVGRFLLAGTPQWLRFAAWLTR